MNTEPEERPLLLDPSQLATRTVPLCLAMISPLTQRPSPVPVVSLVVKNGSKILANVSRVIPEPLSATNKRMPGAPSTHEWERRAESQR